MLEIVSWFIIALFTHILDCYVFCKLIRKEFRFDWKVLNVIIIFSVIDYMIGLNYTGYNRIFKSLVTNLITFLILKFSYNKPISKTLIATLFIYLGYAIAEAFFALIFILFKVNIKFFTKSIGTPIINVGIFIVYLIIFRLNFVLKLIRNIMKWYDKNRMFNLIFTTIISIVLCYSIIYSIIFDSNKGYSNFFILFILFGIIYFVCGYFNQKSGNNKLTIEYGQLLEYVKTYEDEVVDKSKKQHEYKNQLIIIDNLIPKTNKKAKEYLGNILNDVDDVTDNDWLIKLKNLPSGGIKGLIHFKIKKMMSKKISVFVYIDKDVSKKENWKNLEKNLEDISRILGVYLDNAIEAAEKASDKQIVIEFVNEKDNIRFSLSNSYNGCIKFDEIDKEGYSTKGKGRGVGLALVNEIIAGNSLLKQTREINGKFFVQNLYIKKDLNS